MPYQFPFSGADLVKVEVPKGKPFDFDSASPDERLLELARLLENEQEWRNTSMEWEFYLTLCQTDRDCGTAGCALGLAGITWPTFMKTAESDGFQFENPFYAARKLFNLKSDEAQHLFDRSLATDLGISIKDVQPHHVATAIRKFVAARQENPIAF